MKKLQKIGKKICLCAAISVQSSSALAFLFLKNGPITVTSFFSGSKVDLTRKFFFFSYPPQILKPLGVFIGDPLGYKNIKKNFWIFCFDLAIDLQRYAKTFKKLHYLPYTKTGVCEDMPPINNVGIKARI